MSNDSVNSHGPWFTSVQRVRSFESVVSQFRGAILRGDVVPGEKFASERELAGQLGVSRTTLREGLRALESEGIIEIRRGSSGGIFAAIPDGQLVGAALDSLMNLRQASRWEIQEYRRDFEPENAALAARRATEEDIGRLERAVSDFRAGVEQGASAMEVERLDCDVHEAVAAGTHNEVRQSIMIGLAHATTRALEEIPDTGDRSALVLAGDEFSELVRSIRDADPVGAAAIMLQHLIQI